MNKMTKVAVFVGAVLVGSGASAADWNITQEATITVPNPTMTQGGTASVISSDQALNGIALDTASDDLASGTQTSNIAASTGVNMVQGPLVDASDQALNSVSAKYIGSDDTISQIVNQTDVSVTTMSQTDTSPTGSNRQAINLSDASDDVGRLLQNYNESGALTMTQSSMVSSNNVQAVNYAIGDNVGNTTLTQSINVDGIATLTQAASVTGGSNTQAGNIAIARNGDVDNTAQTFTATASDVNLTQATASADNLQATNAIITEAGGDIGNTAGSTTQTTTIAAGGVNFSQTVSGADNVQAGNYASADGDIVDLEQNFEAANSAEVDFDQTPTAANNTQAGNMAVLTTSVNGDIEEISQVFNSSDLSTDFNQNSASGSLTQAGNFIDIGSGDINDSGTTQLFTAPGGTVAMTQSGAGAAAGNLQALNAIVDNAGAFSGGTVSQALNVTAATFTMTQENITSSGQFGNFVGVKF